MIGYVHAPRQLGPYVTGAALMGANGTITNTNTDFKASQSGFAVAVNSSYAQDTSFTVEDFSDGTVYATIWADTDGILKMGGQAVTGGVQIAGDFFTENINPVSNDFIDFPWTVRTTTPGYPSNGIRIFLYEDSGNPRPAYNRGSDNNDFFLDTGSAISDRSIKDNIRPLDSASDTLKSLRGVMYEKDTIDGPDTFGGVIGQELVSMGYPEAVHIKPSGLHMVDPLALSGLLIEGWKDHDKLITDNEHRIRELEAENERLQERVEELK